ncbi:MAG TPA: AAA family ATPase [Streptosporangiaceae bacterium]|nr:AAA family ATPase [Streptosporangiaceae bacterium]
MQEVGRLLERAAGGAGGVLAVTGPPGSGKTALAEAAAAEAGSRGFEVLRADPAEGQPGRRCRARGGGRPLRRLRHRGDRHHVRPASVTARWTASVSDSRS